MEEKTVLTILMATYNGAEYLSKQINSILNQSYRNWELIIRDDQSTDDTLMIIKAFCELDQRIELINYGALHGTACRNFSQLFDWAIENKKEYILFADQDDIWLENKLEHSYQAMLRQECTFGTAIPLLIYSNLNFIDEDDIAIDVQLPLPSRLELSVLINENYAWGCTMMLNRAALQKINHIPADSVNHDYYVALVVAAFGYNILLDEELILYRQHQQNVSGNVDKMKFSSRFHRYFKQTDFMLKPLVANYNLVYSFFQQYKNELESKQKRMISDFLEKYKKDFWSLIIAMFQHKIFKIGFGKNLIYFYTLFLLRKKVIENVEKGRLNENPF